MSTDSAEARQLKRGRWRIYDRGRDSQAMRDPAAGSIATFGTLQEARRWWAAVRPGSPPLAEAPKCARCGGYFSRLAESVRAADGLYHASHAPQPASVAGGRR